MNNNPFHISQSQTMELLDDFQHSVERRMSMYGHRSDFPRMDDFHTNQSELDDYLFDKQAIIDSEGSERSRYTVAGILIVIPIVVLAFLYPVNEMPLGEWTIFVAALAGVLLWLMFSLLKKALIRMRIKKLDKQHLGASQYVDAVLHYGKGQV